jgi:site-specific recombinase XerD
VAGDCRCVWAATMALVDRRPEEDVMESLPLLDCAGRRRSPATLSSFHQGRSPRNKGLRYPPDPPAVEEIIAVMRAAGDGPEGVRLRAVIVVLWRAGLRISEALALRESDLDRHRGAVLVRAGKGGKRREVGMDRWAWERLEPWLELRRALPVGALLCVLRGPTRGRPCAPAGIRGQLRAAAESAGVRRWFAPHQLRHAHAVEMSREGISLLVIQR